MHSISTQSNENICILWHVITITLINVKVRFSTKLCGNSYSYFSAIYCLYTYFNFKSIFNPKQSSCKIQQGHIDKTRLNTYFETLELPVINIQCVGTHQWLKLLVPNFHTFYTSFLSSRAPTVQESSSKLSQYFRQLYSVSTNMGGQQGPRR